MEDWNLGRGLRDIEKEHWITAVWWLCYAIIFGLLPTWVTLIFLPLFKCSLGWSNLVDGGQFALYAAALISAGWYFIGRDFSKTKFPGRSVFVLMFGLLSVFSSLLVAGVAFASVTTYSMDMSWLRYVSLTLFVVAIPLVYLAAAKNEAGVTEDIKSIRDSQQNKLENKFDQTQ